MWIKGESNKEGELSYIKIKGKSIAQLREACCKGNDDGEQQKLHSNFNSILLVFKFYQLCALPRPLLRGGWMKLDHPFIKGQAGEFVVQNSGIVGHSPVLVLHAHFFHQVSRRHSQFSLEVRVKGLSTSKSTSTFMSWAFLWARRVFWSPFCCRHLLISPCRRWKATSLTSR